MCKQQVINITVLPWHPLCFSTLSTGLPWLLREEITCNTGDLHSTPGSGRTPGEGYGNPLQYSYLENSHEQRSLAGYSPWGLNESDTTEQLNTHTHNTVLTLFHDYQPIYLLSLYYVPSCLPESGRENLWPWGRLSLFLYLFLFCLCSKNSAMS